MAGGPADFAHAFRIVAEKATSLDPDSRYQNAGDMLSALVKKEDLNASSKTFERITLKLQDGVFDIDIEGWIFEMQPVELCKHLIRFKEFESALSKFSLKIYP